MSIGDLGHLLIIIAFVASAVAVISFHSGYKAQLETDSNRWNKMGKISLGIQSLAVLGVIGSLYYIIFNHQYEFMYAWKHSSNDMPWYYLISCLWEGQEGSFLLWVFWNSLLSLFLVRKKKLVEGYVIVPFMLIQFFLLSMVLGSHIPSLLTIGSSPFSLLKDTISDEVFLMNPDFIPEDGTGLNPLLQNIWMVIHPPVIFLGFALSGIPFSITIGHLISNKVDQLALRSAPWIIATIGVMGIGIMMGAYWAYETLNFGGYWNWDPVENAVYIPWLVFLSAAHGIVWVKRKNKGVGLTTCLIVSGFLLVLYATFLTRSGILGNASVHAFTDLGLSAQLVIFLLVFIIGSIVLIAYRRKELFIKTEDSPVPSFDFWLMMGIMVIILAAFQVLIGTSIPVFNVIINSLGFDKSFAPPADQVGYYTKYQVWFAILFCIIGAIGQLFYWQKIKSSRQLESIAFLPLLITLFASALFVWFGKLSNIVHIITLFSAILASITSLFILIQMIKTQQSKAMGGLLSHLGLGIMLIGLLFSSAKKEVISQNITINAPDSNLPPHTIQENLLLNRNITKENNGFQIKYLDKYAELETGELIPTSNLINLDERLAINLNTFTTSENNTYLEGDTVVKKPENTFYELEITNEHNSTFKALPRMQNNPNMGYIASPQINHQLTHDIYTHITNFPNPDKIEWTDPESITLSQNQSYDYKGLEIALKSISIQPSAPGISKGVDDILLAANIEIQDKEAKYTATPLFLIQKDRSVKIFPDQIEALGLKLALSKIDPTSGLNELTLSSSQRDWVTIKSIKFPLINLVWFGFLILTTGIAFSLKRHLAYSSNAVEIKTIKEARIIPLNTETRKLNVYP